MCRVHEILHFGTLMEEMLKTIPDVIKEIAMEQHVVLIVNLPVLIVIATGAFAVIEISRHVCIDPDVCIAEPEPCCGLLHAVW